MNYKNIILKGIPSYCTGNGLLIESLLRLYKSKNKYLLIEATANQVNQYGGYSGKTPADFFEYVTNLAKLNDFDNNKLILGGDHLGPLKWQSEDEYSALNKSEDLVRLFVEAGYKKIHLDTSMKVKSDEGKLTDEVIATRGLRLFKACEEEARKKGSEVCYVIGSEVPIPGGESSCDFLEPTTPEAAKNTINTYKRIFLSAGVTEDEWNKKILALVVQPGIEFLKNKVIRYDRVKAKKLMSMRLPNDICYEGHSTDYQTSEDLKNLVHDGVKILKVGPELTFALNSSLIFLEKIEDEFGFEKKSNFNTVLMEELIKNTQYWNRYYDENNKYDFKFSYLDRSRYCMNSVNVERALGILRNNINSIQKEDFIYKFFTLSFGIENQKGRLFEAVIDKFMSKVVEKYENAFE